MIIFKNLIALMIIMSVFTFTLFGIDKWKAQHKRWRISEAMLLFSSLLMGGIGGFLGMYIFHHKTRKRKFRILLPVFAAAQIVLLVWVRNI